MSVRHKRPKNNVNNALSSSRRITRSVSKAMSNPSYAMSLPYRSSAGNNRSGSSESEDASTSANKSSGTSTKRRARSSKLRRTNTSGYAPPSKYAYLTNKLTDALCPNLICVFIGLNPGLTTAETGHAYAHPSNLFWKLLHSSGCTPRRCSPSETYDLPYTYGLGNTNIVARPTANGGQLSKAEMDAGVAALEDKARHYQPEAVVIVGKSIWESIWRVWKGRSIEKHEFRYGWQDDQLRMGKNTTKINEFFKLPEEPSVTSSKGSDTRLSTVNDQGNGGKRLGSWKGARIFVATSTSGLAASLKPSEKEAIWRELGEWVEMRRTEENLIGDRRVRDGKLVIE